MDSRRKLLFATAAVVAVLGGAEAVLRLTGFSYQPFPERIWLGRLAGGVPTGEVVFDRMVPGLFTRDARLFWKPVAGRAPFNAAGLRDDEELPGVKAPGEIRILALGDSCTFLGEPVPWTDLLEARLAAAGQGGVRVLNAGVPAWSSQQGLRYLEDPGLSLAPDLVTVYFGWNDHWRATVKPDHEFPVPGEGVVAAQRLLSRLRLYQGLALLLKGRGAGEAPPFSADEDLATTAVTRPFRVPVERFEANLRRMAEMIGAAGGQTVFITAPSRLTGAAVPAYLFTHGFVARGGEPIESIHSRYAEVVRRVAAETGSLLVDAAAVFAAAADGGQALMRDDGIHLTATGQERLADLLYMEIRQEMVAVY